MTRPWCHGSGRAVPGHSRYQDPQGWANCPVCDLRARLKDGVVDRHRRRECHVPGCQANASLGLVCARHSGGA